MDPTQILILVAIFAVMYFVMIRPQRKRQKEVENMRAGVKTGDRITTIGGLRGKVIRVVDDQITIEVGPEKVRMDFMKWAVSKVDERGVAKSKTDSAPVAKEESEPEQESEVEAPKVVKKPRRLGSVESKEDAKKE